MSNIRWPHGILLILAVLAFVHAPVSAAAETGAQKDNSAAATVTLRSQKSYATSQTMKLYWKAVDGAQGYEFLATNLYGDKLIARQWVDAKTSTTLPRIAAGQFYRLRIRAYSREDGKKVYGTPTYTYIAQQPRVKFKWASHSVVMASWPAVDGASDYTVYASTSPSGKFRKVKTVETRQATIPGISMNRKYYAYVVANLRKGGKSYSSPKTNLYSFRIQGA